MREKSTDRRGISSDRMGKSNDRQEGDWLGSEGWGGQE
jgi:hypothetical protein